MAAFLGNAILTLPQGRNALTVTQMYLAIMENPFSRWRVMHSKQRSSGGPKLISARTARKMNSLQQQYFIIIYMKTLQNNRTRGYFGNRFYFSPSTNDSEIFCMRILLKIHVSWRKKKKSSFIHSFFLHCHLEGSLFSMQMVRLLHK